MKELEGYPHWRKKVKDEIGNYGHLIATSMQKDPEFMKVFKKFPLKYYFF